VVRGQSNDCDAGAFGKRTGWLGERQEAEGLDQSAADGRVGEHVPDVHDGVCELLRVIEERFDLVQKLGCRRDEESQ
jgi:hypothetical protein